MVAKRAAEKRKISDQGSQKLYQDKLSVRVCFITLVEKLENTSINQQRQKCCCNILF